MKVAVLGAGVVGTASAWYLARAGHEVTVLDRQDAPGLETSFANGGQISVSHSEPWANPAAVLKILKWIGREDAPLLFRPRAELAQWTWGLRFLIECLPGRTRRNTEAAYALALYSRGKLQELRRETGIAYDHLERGILHFYVDRRDFDQARARARLLASRGFDIRVKSAGECVAIEPALAHARPMLLGGVHAPSDESGDAYLFTRRLADLAARAGVRFRYHVNVRRLDVEAGRIARAVIDDERGVEESERADAYVVALGSYSPLLLAPLGVSIPVYPVKGYSITLPLEPGMAVPVVAPASAPTVSLTDDARKIVFSRLGDRLRVAGTAELNGFDTQINTARCEALIARTRELFPSIVPPERAESWTAQFWTGLRPATPSNLPIIGRARFPNLHLNTGHGTLGWTLACGSGAALADLMSGRRPEVDFEFCGVRQGFTD